MVDREPMRLSFHLPWPPSINRYWRSPRSGRLAGRVLLSKDGRAYRALVGLEILRQRVTRFKLTGRLGITVLACPPDRRVRDLDNLWKGCLDAIAAAGVVSNDGDFDDLRILRGPIVPDGLLHVEIVELRPDNGFGSTASLGSHLVTPRS